MSWIEEMPFDTATRMESDEGGADYRQQQQLEEEQQENERLQGD